jgi:hypothetical protein
MDLLEKLRSNLEHFRNSPDFGDAETVEAICRHLAIRIRETEGWVRMIEAEQPGLGIQFQAKAA